MELFFLIVIVEMLALNYEVYSVRNEVVKAVRELERIHIDLSTKN